MRNLFKLTALLALFIIGCSTESTTDPQNVDTANLSAAIFQKSNIGMYKGVFTTMDSQQRGTIEISIPDASALTVNLTDPYPFAKLTLIDGQQFIARSSTPVVQGTAVKNLLFSSSIFKFNFSVDANGRSPQVSGVTFQGLESDIVAAKHTTRAPVIPIPGTYACTDCGTHPNLNNTITQTFSILTSTDPDGNSSFTTQTVLGSNVFSGVGIQENCVASGIRTTCDIESGNGISNAGIIINGTTVVWSGTHTFDNSSVGGSDDCSGVTGTWIWPSANFGTLSGTFVSDTMCPPPPAGPLVDEDFEDNTFDFTPSNPLFHDGSSDYVHIVPLNGPGETDIVRPAGSNHHFGVEDMDDGSTQPLTVNLDWTNLDVSGFSSVDISALFAESNADGFERWDSDSSVRVEVSLDGGTFMPVIAFETANPSLSNQAPQLDTNFDGNGDGAALSNVLTEFSTTVNVAGANLLTVRIVISGLNGTQEDVAIDNFLVEGN